MTIINCVGDTAAQIQIGDFKFLAEVSPATTKRDHLVPDLAKSTSPLPISKWPMSPTKIEDIANQILADKNGHRDRRDDCIWALRQTEAVQDYRYIIALAMTDAEREDEHGKARRKVLAGRLT